MPAISRYFINYAKQLASHNANAHFLWIIDDGFHFEPKDFDSLLGIAPSICITIITNRYNLTLTHYASQNEQLHLHFSDFDFSKLNSLGFDAIFYRVSKEKPVVHHVLNNAAAILQPTAALVIAGRKNEGTKTYLDKLSKQLGLNVKTKKEGELYFGIANTPTTENTSTPLDSSNYNALREVATCCDLPMQSKPGVYGWKKFDLATQQLIEFIKQRYNNLNEHTVLDLGCGSGYLSIAVKTLHCRALIATDNNAAAVLATEQNLITNNLAEATQVVADDCAQSIQGVFDLVVCNPPFHKGFETSRELSDLFLKSTAHKLSKNGEALFVVNSFIPLEKLATPYFKQVEKLQDDKSFKIVRLAH
ncbi:class I SAM-dependent methyltransferase [Saccharophagus degradans]|uniref:Methyltransferase n=1 Tax=Saccharophagus degradans TaxID=86304 RepID=A0AAW7X0I1_9GAMM|nr:methyltransferase [Saccharophagus degradans]MDO6421266.1 methyltransferase [Saccharophagus degradans]MDO6605823.1 methyltransferase [Saccharophagus degradans]